MKLKRIWNLYKNLNLWQRSVYLKKNLVDESKEGLLVLEDFEETIKRAREVNEASVYEEAENLAKNEASGVVGTIKSLPRALGTINWIEVYLALGTIVIIYGFKRITTAIPSTLVALIIVSGIAIGFGIDYRSIQQIPDGFPQIRWTLFTDVKVLELAPYILTALTLSLLGTIDSLLTSVVADNLTKTRHLPSKELIGQGIGNSIGAIFGGIPGAGATIRTVVNIQSGGKTKLFGMVFSSIINHSVSIKPFSFSNSCSRTCWDIGNCWNRSHGLQRLKCTLKNSKNRGCNYGSSTLVIRLLEPCICSRNWLGSGFFLLYEKDGGSWKGGYESNHCSK